VETYPRPRSTTAEDVIVPKPKSKSKPKPNKTNAYIAKCPKPAHAPLEKIRAAIRAAAPGATERTDYFQWPGYSYSDPTFDYDGMFAWFTFKHPHIRLHVRPAAIQKHKKELAAYTTTVAVVCFPMDKFIPIALAKKLVKASVTEMKSKAKTNSKPRSKSKSN
jgi:uncharacterized protein YdhG (YjbR/CyaY superfamily)